MDEDLTLSGGRDRNLADDISGEVAVLFLM